MVDLIGAADEAAIAAIDDRGGSLRYGELLTRARGIAAEIGPVPALVMLEGGANIDWLAAYVGCLLGGHPVMLVPAGDTATATRLAASYQPEFGLTAGGDYRPRRLRNPGGARLHPDLAVILSTSGSTGSTKCVRLSHANIAANARSIGEYLGLRPDERGVVSLPTHYSYGLSVVNSHLAAGATLLLTARSVIEPEFWDFCTEHGATSFAGVPYSYELLQRIDLARKAPPSLRYFTQAGGRLSAELVQHFGGVARENGWRFYVMYGQTEATARMAYLPPDQLEAHPDCIGVAIPGGRFELVDAAGQPVTAAMAEGELVYHGPNVMMGYATEPAELALPPGPARLPTGDLARRTADGLYQITGRLSRFIKVFGNRVGLDDVEQILEREGHPAIATGVDEHLLVATRYAGAEPLIEALLSERLHLPADKITVRVVEDYPLLASGKIDYAGLKAELVAELEREAWWSVATVEPEDRGAAVRQIFADVFGSADDESASFNARGGDSLTYISTVLALEPLIPELPDDWSDLSLAELVALAEASGAAGVSAQALPAVPKNLDTVRALACVMVVALHVVGLSPSEGLRLPDGSPWHQAMGVLGLIRMPLFTALAGFLYSVIPANRSGFVPFMRRKIDTLLWPLLFSTLVYWVIRVEVMGSHKTLFGAYFEGFIHLWYIDALLIWFAIVAALDTLFTMTSLRWAAALVVFTAAQWFVPLPVYFNSPDIVELFPYFIIGILLHRIPALWNGQWPWLFGVAAAAFGLGVWQYLAGHTVREPGDVVPLLASTGAVILAIGLCPRIRLIEGIAFYTFTIYLWHPAANSVVRTILGKVGVDAVGPLFFTGMFVGIVAPIMVHKLMERWPIWLRAPVIGR